MSYLKYVYVGVALNELTDLNLQCSAAQIASKTCISTGTIDSVYVLYCECNLLSINFDCF